MGPVYAEGAGNLLDLSTAVRSDQQLQNDHWLSPPTRAPSGVVDRRPRKCPTSPGTGRRTRSLPQTRSQGSTAPESLLRRRDFVPPHPKLSFQLGPQRWLRPRQPDQRGDFRSCVCPALSRRLPRLNTAKPSI